MVLTWMRSSSGRPGRHTPCSTSSGRTSRDGTRPASPSTTRTPTGAGRRPAEGRGQVLRSVIASGRALETVMRALVLAVVAGLIAGCASPAAPPPNAPVVGGYQPASKSDPDVAAAEKLAVDEIYKR